MLTADLIGYPPGLFGGNNNNNKHALILLFVYQVILFCAYLSGTSSYSVVFSCA